MNQYSKQERFSTTHPIVRDEAARIAAGRKNLRVGTDYARVAEIFRALGDPSRVTIVDALLHQELCTSDLDEVIGLSEPAVSQHLRLLRMLRVVSSHRHGHRVFHTLDDEHVRNLLELTMDHLRDADVQAAG